MRLSVFIHKTIKLVMQSNVVVYRRPNLTISFQAIIGYSHTKIARVNAFLVFGLRLVFKNFVMWVISWKTTSRVCTVTITQKSASKMPNVFMFHSSRLHAQVIILGSCFSGFINNCSWNWELPHIYGTFNAASSTYTLQLCF